MKLRLVGTMAMFALVGAVAVGARPVAAQDAGVTDHPLIGVWEMKVDLGEGDTNCPAQLTITPGGGAVDVDCEGVVAVGVWEPTGEQTATLNFTSYNPDLGRYQIRVAIEVAEDDQTFTGSFTFELIDADSGEGTGQFGPGSASATRQTAEAPGTPVGTISEMYAQVASTPEATPAG